MKDILMYTHFYKDYAFLESDWHTPLANEKNVSNPKCKIIEKHKNLNPSLPIGEYDSFVHIAKNNKEAKYVGVNHYRRYPDFLNHNDHPCYVSRYMPPTQLTFQYLTSNDQKETALNLLSHCDVIHYTYKTLPENYIQQWAQDHPTKAFDILIEELSKKGYKESVDFFYKSNQHIWGSPLITKWEIFKEYVDFYLEIINSLLERSDFVQLTYDPIERRYSNKRLLSFIGERLIPFWSYHKKLNPLFVPFVGTEPDALK